MSGAASPVSGKAYGLAAVCRIWGLGRAGVYRRRLPPRAEPPRRPGPVGGLTDAVLLLEIHRVLAASRFHGEGHRKIWARLRASGVRTSKRRVLRLTREHGLLAPSRAGSPRGPRSHDGTIIPATVDTMWGTDLTTTFTGEGPAAVFIAIDHCSAECVGIHASARATRFEALEPVRQGCAITAAASPATSPTASACGTIMARNTCRTTSRRRSPSSASQARLPSSARQKETAAPSGSSAR